MSRILLSRQQCGSTQHILGAYELRHMGSPPIIQGLQQARALGTSYQGTQNVLGGSLVAWMSTVDSRWVEAGDNQREVLRTYVCACTIFSE